MAPYAREVPARLAADGRRVVPIVDQTQATGRPQLVMVAARVGGRALPLAWRVVAAQAAIGFAAPRGFGGGRGPAACGDRAGADGRPLLRPTRPDRPVPAARLGWRLRLEQDLLVFEDGGETTVE